MNIGHLFIAEAVAAEVIINRLFQLDQRFLYVAIAIQVLCILGWAGSSLPRLAEWPDGSLSVKLTILQGVVIALIAGNAAYFAGFYLMNGLPEIACFIATIVAAWGGDKFLTPMLDRVSSVITNLIGKNP